MKTRCHLLLFVLLALVQVGCELVNQQVVAGLRKYFPGATIVPQRGGIEIETGISTGVGRNLCLELFRSFSARPEFQQLQQGMKMANYRFFALNFGEWCIVWLPQEPGLRVVTRQISNTALWMQQPLEPFSFSSISGSGSVSASASSSGYTSQSAGLASQNSTVVPRGAFRVVWSTTHGVGSVLVTSTQRVSMQLIRNAATLRIEEGIPPSDFLKVEDNKTTSVFFAVPPGAGIAIVNNSRKDAEVKVAEIAPR